MWEEQVYAQNKWFLEEKHLNNVDRLNTRALNIAK